MAQQPLHTIRAAWVAWLILSLAVLAGAWWWWQIGRPVAMPDASSTRIACVSYQPFHKPGQTPLDPSAFIPPEQIEQDLAALSKRVDCVRTYSQSQGASVVPEIAARHGLKVLLGIWIGSDKAFNEREMRLGIANAQKYPDVLRGIIVGNEVLLRGEQSPRGLAAYLQRVRAATHVPVTYADVWEFWLRYPEMAKSVDYLTVHIIPYWENDPVPPQDAVEHARETYARVQQTFPGRRIMIGETGWPSKGRPRDGTSASLVNETLYLRGFLSYANEAKVPYNIVEAFDQPWKRKQEGTAGGYWGVFDADAQPKVSMTGPVVEEPHWLDGWIAGAAGALLFALVGAVRRSWRGGRGWGALILAGFASGTALAWQYRQMVYACDALWEWVLAITTCLIALYTALRLARQIATWLAGGAAEAGPDGRLRFGWMFLLGIYALLLVFDGRYRDFPLGVFALPSIGFAVAGWLDAQAEPPMLEERFLAFWLPALAAVGVVQEAGLDPSTWLWLCFNLAIAIPVALARRQHLSLLAQQA